MTRLDTYLADLQRFGIRPGLERIEALLSRVNEPHRSYPHILIGGTNGKGSTCEFAARLLSQSGRKVGLYTSPHLYSWNERIRILPGEGLFTGAISDKQMDELFEVALPHIEAVATDLGQPTEFEVVTFLGLWHFARQQVDAAILEVGLGGKWDATNVTNPEVSVVTHVALDHCDRLGDTLEAIAADKVHIARRNRPFITAETKPNVLEVFEDYCKAISAELKRVPLQDSDDFQHRNFQTACLAVQEFTSKVDWPEIEYHLDDLNVRGRREVIQQRPQVIIDGANNPDGARQLVQWLRDTARLEREQLILVLAILADKDWREMTATLAPLARQVLVAQSDSPRALAASELAEEARKFNAAVDLCPSVAAAVERAKALAAPTDTVVVTGSFTAIAEVPRNT